MLAYFICKAYFAIAFFLIDDKVECRKNKFDINY